MLKEIITILALIPKTFAANTEFRDKFSKA